MQPKEIELALVLDDIRRRLRDAEYNPHRGTGCSGHRREVATPVEGLPCALVPVTMTEDPQYTTVLNNATAWKRLRCRHDFEYWAANCVKIKDKVTADDIPFVLNAPQRRLLDALEADRLAGKPIRVIVLKARQWGGSTLVQNYMAWIQSCHRRNWHSVICAHVKDAASGIRGMYTKLLDNYPEELWEGDEKPVFKPFERSTNVREIAGRGCRVTIGSSENQEAVRGADYAMAHLSETAYWASTPQRSPEGVVRAVCGSVALLPYTLIAMESTANGIGNYFHTEWERSKAGRSDKTAVFVPWYEIEMNRLERGDKKRLIESMDEYEERLWRIGLCFDQIRWYRRKLSEYTGREQMAAEFPTDDVEAFANSGNNVFDPRHVAELRKGCTAGRLGEVSQGGDHFSEDAKGKFRLWREPVEDMRYVVAVDVGGRSEKSDWSVIAVMAFPWEGLPEVVAQWRGHTDHDILAHKAADIGRFYNEALLVIESNTFETDDREYGGDPNLFILNRLMDEYQNLYLRESYDSVTKERSTRVGFHTNRATKSLLIGTLIEAVREGGFIERDAEACSEFAVYTRFPNGSFGARQGHHDDILMTRAMALLTASTNLPDTRADIPLVDRW